MDKESRRQVWEMTRQTVADTGSKSAAARALGVSRETINNHLRHLGIPIDSKAGRKSNPAVQARQARIVAFSGLDITLTEMQTKLATEGVIVDSATIIRDKAVLRSKGTDVVMKRKRSRRPVTKQQVLDALVEARGDIQTVAKRFGVSRGTVYNRLSEKDTPTIS